jgi:hypothetical protein
MTPRKFKTRHEYERERELATLQSTFSAANPDYVQDAAGFWLERWLGERSRQLGRTRRKKPCATTTASTKPPASSAFCLST